MNKLSLLLLTLLTGCVNETPRPDPPIEALWYTDSDPRFVQEGEVRINEYTTVKILSVNGQKYLIVDRPNAVAITKHEQVQAEKQ